MITYESPREPEQGLQKGELCVENSYMLLILARNCAAAEPYAVAASKLGIGFFRISLVDEIVSLAEVVVRQALVWDISRVHAFSPDRPGALEFRAKLPMF